MGKLGSPRERAERIKEYVDRARDSEGRLKINWSHLLLATLVENGYVNRILTTNFDPLIVEALAVMGQPIRTYDLNTTGNYNPGSLDKASIIYLHGQMHSLFLANSGDELEKLQKLYPSVLQEAVQDSLLIVVGYSGGCDPVLDALADLTNFPRGLWWSDFGTAASPGSSVDRLFEKHGADCHLCEGHDSDSFMKKLVIDGMKLDLPDEVLKPVTAIKKALERITRFPQGEMAEPDPVHVSLEMLCAMEEQLEQSAPEHVRTSSQTRETTKLEINITKATAEELARILPLEMSSMTGDWVEFNRLRTNINAKPNSRIAQAIGDGLVRQASNSTPDASLEFLMEAERIGVTPQMNPSLYMIWGNTLSQQARLKENTPEGDALFEQSFLKYAEAIRLKPDMHETFNNWGEALAAHAKLKGDTAEGRTFFEQAIAKFSNAIQIKPNQFEPIFNLGNTLLSQGKTKGHKQQAEALFEQAALKLSEAAHIRPDRHEAFSSWGNALLHHAELKWKSPAVDSLCEQAAIKYAEAIRLKPDKCESINNWGAALVIQAGCKGNTEEAASLVDKAILKITEAVHINPDMDSAFINWGNALQLQAKLKGNTTLGDAIFEQAYLKYAKAIHINPDSHGAFCSWGDALQAHAKLKGNTPEASSLYEQAALKYADAIRIKPDMSAAFDRLGSTFVSQAKIKGNSPASDVLFEQAVLNYAEAARLNPEIPYAINNWGTALMAQATLKGDSLDGEALFEQAALKFTEAGLIKPDFEGVPFNFACLSALRGKCDEVLAYLKRWKELCPTAQRSTLDNDVDFDRIRNDPKFHAFRETLPN